MNQTKLIHKHENLYFGLLVASSIMTILVAIVLTFATYGFLLVIIGFIVSLSMFAHWVQIGYIRTNGVKVTKHQFTDLYETYQRVGQGMGIRMLPDVYILQAGGILNAFATRFFQKNMIILYSDIVELSRNGQVKEVEFVIAHELAHIRRNHVQKQWLVLLGNIVPFLGSAYSRACEYTCDRMAAHYIQDEAAAKQALTVLAIGGTLAKEVNEFDYLQEASRENGFIAKYSELISTHPTLPKRIAAIATAAGEVNVPVFKTAGYVKASIIGTIALTVVLNGAIIAWLVMSDGFTSLASTPFIEEFDDMDPILELAYDNASYEEFEAEISTGADVNVQDGFGDTPLHNLFYNEEVDYATVELLLKNGADASIKNLDEMTPRDLAIEGGYSFELVELLRKYE
ncbi:MULTISPECIES: M48 family metallopeptidase [Exiguobacterium]|uniref:M48 family metallopeptidase n=1 Tax=Exiguobacterium TaxID=33986 RepID=UPI001BE9EEAD|nr:M48 family metallopeptidase [Exiguobacterium himgiriensis]MCT4782982.1 M48 family metalloprotease [Exiguobacterium himgiriensis]